MAGKKRAIKPNLSLSSAADTQFAKLSKKEQGKNIGGNPDEWDVNNIQRFLDLYEAAFPGQIRRMRDDAEVQYALSDGDKFAVLSKDSDLRRGFWLPNDLQAALEIAYPSFWTNPKHGRWFMRHFPVFSWEDIAQKVKR